MRVSITWIKRLLKTDDLGMSIDQLQAQLTQRVAEFESVVELTGPKLAGVVVGRVLTCAQHPGADRLRVTTVDVGTATALRIVCGAPNVAAGQTVAVATIGAQLSMPGKDGVLQTLTIKPVTLRGEPSEGMICAEDELGLGTSHQGVLVLDGTLVPGTPLREALKIGDTVLVIENHAITHRPDLWGQLGWAREIAAICGVPPPPPVSITLPGAAPGREPALARWSVEIQDDGCLVYAGAVLSGLAQAESPAWMRGLLESMGVRPLGLLVDVTNIVMFELGEPMHAFDRRDIAGTHILVRSALAKEPFTTLDGRDHALARTDLLIADESRALAVAGIMGGQGSMIRPDTSSIVLEAAVFAPERIRRTRKRLGLATDASARFEKGLYPELAAAGLNRAIALLRESCPELQVVDVFAQGRLAGHERTIAFVPEHTMCLTGLDIPPARQIELLRALGFQIDGDQVRVPWWRRKDVSMAVDLVEEIARSFGYQHIVPQTPRLPAGAPPINVLRTTEHQARRLMSALGWDEVATYAFTSQAWVDALALDLTAIQLSHPLSSDQGVMRPSLIPNLLQAVAGNLKHAKSVSLYEIGKRYADLITGGDSAAKGRHAHEEMVIAGLVSESDDTTPFYLARDAALALLEALGYPCVAMIPEQVRPAPAGAWLTPSRTVLLYHSESAGIRSGAPIGVVTEIPHALRERAGCPYAVGFFEIHLERLLDRPRHPIRFSIPSRFPVVERQYTWDCPETLTFHDLEAQMRGSAGGLCTGVALDSIYRGSPVEKGRKAVSLRIFLQAPDRTLDDKQLQQVHERILSQVQSGTSARIRQ